MDLADAHRHVRDAIDGVSSRTLRSLIVNEDLRADGVVLGLAGAGPIPVSNIRVDGTVIVGDDLMLRISVPDDGLRAYLAYMLAEMASEDDNLELDAAGILDFKVPNDITRVVAEIKRWRGANSEERLMAVLLIWH